MVTPINFDEDFPHLSRAPIVEAAMDIRVVPSVPWDENNLQTQLKQRLADYPKIEQLREARYQVNPAKGVTPTVEDFGCVGLKLHAADSPYIAQFNKVSFVFSRLKPYEDWVRFHEEAFRLWTIYNDLLRPTEVRRIGLRFINRIAIQQSKVELSDYYKNPPAPLKDLDWPLGGYLHHDVIQVPGTSYSVNLIKTVQNVAGEIGLILDIDVFSQNHFQYDEAAIRLELNQMRWVKNKIFFNSLTTKALEELK